MSCWISISFCFSSAKLVENFAEAEEEDGVSFLEVNLLPVAEEVFSSAT